MTYHQYWMRILCVCLIMNVGMIQSISYFIKDKAIPSYLYHYFDVIEDDLFPKDIRIDVALSSVIGTLLYSIDRNMNQLIITLRDDILEGTRYGLVVELNTQYELVSLSELCAPRFGNFNLQDEFRIHIQIDNYISLRCNGGNVVRFRNQRQRRLDIDYPLMFNASARTPGQKNAAHLWLVNHPKIGQVLPNNEQMYGCIFDVQYKDKSIEFMNYSSNIVPKCEKACTVDMCNGGECLAVYSSEPICNCTVAFQNGRLCGDEMRKQNIRATSQEIMTKIFKLSWNSDSKEIMELKNNFVRYAIRCQGSNLSFEYNYIDHRNKSDKILLIGNYKPNTNTICVGYFFEKHVYIRIYNNNVWKSIHFGSPSNLGDEKYHTIVLQSGEGVIDIVAKFHVEYRWRAVDISNPQNIEDQSKNQATTIAMSIILPCLFLAIVISVVLVIRWKCRRYKYHDANNVVRRTKYNESDIILRLEQMMSDRSMV